jgi:hypothetical protein
MAGISTYRFLSETIINQHYGSFPMEGADISQKHVAELIATKIAKYAKISAFEIVKMVITLSRTTSL